VPGIAFIAMVKVDDADLNSEKLEDNLKCCGKEVQSKGAL